VQCPSVPGFAPLKPHRRCSFPPAGDSEETQETAGRVPERARPEPAVRAHVLPGDGAATPEDHAVADVVRAPSVRAGARAAVDGDGRQPEHAVAQDGHLHGPVQISGRRRVQAAAGAAAAGRQSSAAVATAAAAHAAAAAVVVVRQVRRERIAVETFARYVAVRVEYDLIAHARPFFSSSHPLHLRACRATRRHRLSDKKISQKHKN